ncbi:TIGR01244 family sulfur transferase [Hyphococcus sp.]|uniref:TIGR01244 family sulfur transferase n=1 Tax=Hyphococcus sp. TaxID=2038636 RepID=UPI0035C66F56
MTISLLMSCRASYRSGEENDRREGETTMSEKFIPLSETFWVSPQITPEEAADAADKGVTLIVNNRPDGEAPGQPKSDAIAAAAEKAGISYIHIPVDGRGVTPSHISALKEALEANKGGKALGFCRTGTRSTILRAYVEAFEGRAPEEIIAEAAKAGYDISGHAPALKALGGAA